MNDVLQLFLWYNYRYFVRGETCPNSSSNIVLSYSYRVKHLWSVPIHCFARPLNYANERNKHFPTHIHSTWCMKCQWVVKRHQRLSELRQIYQYFRYVPGQLKRSFTFNINGHSKTFDFIYLHYTQAINNTVLVSLYACSDERACNLSCLYPIKISLAEFMQTPWPGPWFNITMSSNQYRKSHCGYKTVIRSSYLHNGISYTGMIKSLYWTNPSSLLIFSANGFTLWLVWNNFMASANNMGKNKFDTGEKPLMQIKWT